MTAIRPSPLPTRDGVSAGRLVVPAGHGPLLIDYLAQRFTFVSITEIAERMLRGEVVDEHGTPLMPDQPCTAHLVVYYYRALPKEEHIPFEETVLFQDDRILVVDKPHFLPVTPSGRFLQETLLIRLIRTLGIQTLTPIHRLDRETAGVMVFSIRPDDRGLYQGLFQKRSVYKEYEAIAGYREDLEFPLTRSTRLVAGEPFMRMQESTQNDDRLPNAHTSISLMEVFSDRKHARYKLTPSTGKKHQLRVHMAALGIPIVNDTMYPHAISAAEIADTGYQKPLQLLARRIAFDDPISGQRRDFSSLRTLNF